jgi:hypothetical protein
MPGFSVTLLLLPRVELQNTLTSKQILELLDMPTIVPAWKSPSTINHVIARSTTAEVEQMKPKGEQQLKGALPYANSLCSMSLNHNQKYQILHWSLIVLRKGVTP